MLAAGNAKHSSLRPDLLDPATPLALGHDERLYACLPQVRYSLDLSVSL